MKKNILITGASGFIGSFLVEEALRRNYKTIAGIRSGSSKQYLNNPEIFFLELDFSNPAALDEAIRNYTEQHGKMNYVIHAAGVTKVKEKKDFFSVNTDNTQKLIAALQRNDQVPDKFILISSLAAYGPGSTDGPIRATHQKNPVTDYGRSKLQAEALLFNDPGFPSLIINPTAVYGPRDKDVFFLLKTIANHVELYIGNKKQILSFVHVQDLCSAVFLALESTAVNKNLLVSDLNAYTTENFNQVLKKQLGARTVSLVLPFPLMRAIVFLSEGIGHLRGRVSLLNRERLKEFEAPNWSVDCTDIVELGYQPKFNLEDGMANSIQWYKEKGWLKNK